MTDTASKYHSYRYHALFAGSSGAKVGAGTRLGRRLCRRRKVSAKTNFLIRERLILLSHAVPLHPYAQNQPQDLIFDLLIFKSKPNVIKSAEAHHQLAGTPEIPVPSSAGPVHSSSGGRKY
jgi:hypothetical protein